MTPRTGSAKVTAWSPPQESRSRGMPRMRQKRLRGSRFATTVNSRRRRTWSPIPARHFGLDHLNKRCSGSSRTLADYGVTRVAHLTHLDRVGIPVHTAHKPAGKSLSNGSGKGVTPEASRIGAMMEAIEQTYWEDSPIPRLLASSAQLDADGIARVDPEDIPMNRGTSSIGTLSLSGRR